jgi:hypothetical protein
MKEFAMSRGLLIQYGIDQKLTYHALKKVMPDMERYVVYDLRSYIRGMKNHVYDYVLLDDPKLFINFRKHLPLFLFMYRNFKSGHDIFKDLDKQKVKGQQFNIAKMIETRKSVEKQLESLNLDQFEYIGQYTIEQSVFLMLIGLFYIKKNHPDKKIICGGNWFELTDVATKMFLEGNLIDLVIYGDGEILPQVYDKTGEVTYFQDNIDDIPQIAVQNWETKTLSGVPWKVNAGCFYGTKGCPYSCSFCMQGMHKYRRVSSTELIGDQIEESVKSGISEFYISDNIWLKDLILELHDELERRNLIGKVKFEHCNVHPVTCISEETVKAIKRMNLHPFLGIESFSTRILKLMNKKTTKELNLRSVETLDKHGSPYTMGRIFQFPGETPKDFDESLREYTRIFTYNYNSRWLGTFTLYPKTDIFNNPDKYGIEYTFFGEEIEGIVPEFAKYVRQIASSYIDLADPDDKKFKKYDKKLRVINEHITKVFK